MQQQRDVICVVSDLIFIALTQQTVMLLYDCVDRMQC